MKEFEHIATCGVEEACEVGQRITKAMRFGFDEVQAGQSLDNGARIVQEFHDLYSTLSWLQELGYIDAEHNLTPSPAIIASKKDRIRKYMPISRAQGVLD